jgi:DNA-binding LacI/PurR family transcriptional regulator
MDFGMAVGDVDEAQARLQRIRGTVDRSRFTANKHLPLISTRGTAAASDPIEISTRCFYSTATEALPKRVPSAIFVRNEPMVSGCILALKERGLRVPPDIAVIGFDW